MRIFLFDLIKLSRLIFSIAVGKKCAQKKTGENIILIRSVFLIANCLEKVFSYSTRIVSSRFVRRTSRPADRYAKEFRNLLNRQRS